MPVTLTASEVPIPTGPTAGVSISGCTSSSTTAPTLDPVASGSLSGLALQLNKLQAAIANIAGFAGNGYGVINGLDLSDGGGLICNVAAGNASIFGIVQRSATTVVVPDDTPRVFVWLKVDGTVVVEVDTDPPTANAVFLGSLVTDSGAILSFDTSGVCYMRDGRVYRETADRGAPNDTPDASRCFVTKTLAGRYEWTGEAYASLGIPVNVETLTTTRQLTILDAPRQILTPSGSSQIVLLPDPGDILPDSPNFDIFNAATSGSFDVVVKTSDGITTISTIPNGEYAPLPVSFGGASGGGSYPTTAVTPVAPSV